MTKVSLRKKMLLIRSQIPNRPEQDEAIFDKLISLEKIKNASNILIYYSVSSEVDTHKFIEWCFEHNKRVFVPFLNEIEIGEIKSFEDLVMKGKFYEPKSKAENQKPKLNLEIELIGVIGNLVAIVPGLAFDKNGNRLGYGKGIYDQLFLKSQNSDLESQVSIYKIGICYKEQFIDSIPIDEHDVRMDLVIAD